MQHYRTLLALSGLCVLISCGNVPTQARLDKNAEEIEEFLVSFTEEFTSARDRFQYMLSGTGTPPDNKYSTDRYQLLQGKLLYHDPEEGIAAIFATGVVPLGVKQWREIRIFESLEVVLKQLAVRHSGLVKQSFINLLDGVCVIYPAFNVAAFVPPGYDFYSFDPATFDLQKKPNNPRRRPIYGPPYIDMVGHGLLITLRAPIDIEGEWSGYLGADLDLEFFRDRFIDVPNRALLLMTDKGILLAASAAAAELLGIAAQPNYSYLRQMPAAIIPREADLLQHESEEIRRLASSVIATERSRMVLAGKQRIVLRQMVKPAGWLLVEVSR